MDFEYSQKVKDLQEKVTNFMNENVYENEDDYKNGRIEKVDLKTGKFKTLIFECF